MTVQDSSDSGPVGLAGWLVLVGIGLLISPIRLLILTWSIFAPIILEGYWAVLTTPGSEVYHPMWAPLLVVELVANVALIFTAICLIILFFMRSRSFPRVYTWMAVLSLLFIVLDMFATKLILPDEPLLDPGTARELGRAIFTVAIWVPYMHRSKRVKNTFVE